MNHAEDKWVDVGPLFQQACDEMSVEDLIHGEHFSLFEAMSAIEIGCIKMDAGATRTASVDELIEQGNAPADLTSAQLLAVLDKLLVLQANWQRGDSMAQTIYSCLYMLRSERIADHLPLSSFCKALRATCIELRSAMMQAAVCEDEDISIVTNGLPVTETNAADAEEKCLAAVSLALDRVENLRQLRQQAACLPEGDAGSTSTRKEGFQVDAAHHDALVARLSFQKHLLQAIRKMVKLGREDLEAAKKLLLSCLAELKTIRATANLAGELVGFDHKVNFHLLAPAPPRPFTELSQADAWDHYDRTLQLLVRACTAPSITSYVHLQSFLEAFVAAAPTTPARALLHLQLVNRTLDGGAAHPWTPAAPMICHAVAIPLTPPPPADVNMFLEQAQIAVANWVQANLLNKARRRRRLRRVLEDWAHLYQHALVADTTPEVMEWMETHGGWKWAPLDNGDVQGPLATWVEMEACRLSLQHLLAGFSLELYQPCEYPLVFWYCSFLYDALLNDLRHLTMLRPLPPAPAAPPPRATGKGLRPRSKDLRAAAEAREAAALEFRMAASRELLYHDTHRAMCQAMMRITLALRHLGLLPPHSSPFNDEASRFTQRFASLHLLERPTPLTYQQFLQSTDPTTNSPTSLLAAADTALQQVRSSVRMILSDARLAPSAHQVETAQQLDRLAMQTSVACAVLSKLMAAGAAPTPSFEFTLHPSFPAVALKGANKPLPKAPAAATADAPAKVPVAAAASR